MIATQRIWTARPLLVAYIVALGFTIGMLVNRTPPAGQTVPALAGAGDHGDAEQEAPVSGLWEELFHPSQPTARWLLRLGLPMLSVADGSAREAERRTLRVYWTGQAGEHPQTFFEAMLPFLNSDKEGTVAAEPQQPVGDGTGTGTGTGPGPDSGQPPAPTAGAGPGNPPSDGTKPAPVAGGQPLVGIYHTHDWESYISEFPAFVPKQPSDLGKIQSEDHTKRTVMGVGRSLALRLQQLGVSTVYADYTHRELGYDYAYQASRGTVKEILKKAPTVKVLLDIHRDSGWGVDETTTIDGKKVAMVRCIIGKENPHWEQNKAFCDNLMQRLEEKHPGLTLQTRVQNDNYNQDVLPGAILIEVGGALNQYAEADRSTQYLSEALAAMVREGAYPK